MSDQWQPQYQPGQGGRPPATPPPWGQQQPDPWAGSAAQSAQPQWQQPQYQPPGYGPQFPPPGPPRRQPGKSRTGLFAGLGCGGLAVIFIIIAAVAGSHSSSSSSVPPVAVQPVQTVAPVQTKAAVKPPPQSPAATQTLTYAVTGSPANVTYGPTGTNVSGSVPLRVSGPLGSPLYYSITAQLQGDGEVTCQILIDGKVISQGTASGGYNIAQCEIIKNPLSGQWQDTNS